MKTLILLAVMSFVAAEPEYYNVPKIDIDKLTNDIEELKECTNCLLEKKPCNILYEGYRVHTQEAVQQACKKCSPYVRHNFGLYLQALQAILPEDYLEFRHKYDPENKYFDALEAELQKYSPECFKVYN